jgi:hypothetical protein
LPDIGHLDVCIGRNLLKKWEVAKNWLFVTFVAVVFVASRKRPVHACLPRDIAQAYELPAYSKRAYIDR